jgi:hypothetical protein
MTAAVLSRGEVRAAAAAALQRVRGRQTSDYSTITEQERRQAWLEGRELREHDWHAPAVRPAESFAEWADDTVLAWRQLEGDPVQPLIVAIIEAARASVEDAVRLLRAARDLPREAQWSLYQNFGAWRGHEHADRLGLGRLALALLAEWKRLGLADTDPAAQPAGRRRRRRWEIAEEATA